MQTEGSELDALEKTCEAFLKHALKMKDEIDYHCGLSSAHCVLCQVR